jgi:dienelactone hydrolase
VQSTGEKFMLETVTVSFEGRVCRSQEQPFDPNPTYHQVQSYTTAIAADGDLADVYYPILPTTTADQIPIALMLQEAFVDKADYANYAKEVASYGFVVVVPNNERTLTTPDGQPLTGLLAEEQQVNEVLAQIRLEDANPASPIFEIADTTSVGLLGHGFGGFVGLAAIQDITRSASTKDYTRPPELKAGILYSTSFQAGANSGIFPTIDNQDIPTGLIVGTLDSVNDLSEVASTYVKIQDPPKALITVEGANLDSITNQDLDLDPSSPTLDQATATGAIGRWSGLFLRSHLLGDQGALGYTYKTGGDIDSNVNVTSLFI